MKNILLSTFFLGLITVVGVAHAAGPNAVAQGNLYVEVRSAKLKSKPDYLASNLADLPYGAALTRSGDSVDGGWLKVRSSNGVVGYVHSSAISTRRVVLAGSANKKVLNSDEDSSDIVMAGKGFNKEVEKEFAASNPTLNLSAVNAMERLKVGEGDTRAFAKSGGLLKGGQS